MTYSKMIATSILFTAAAASGATELEASLSLSLGGGNNDQLNVLFELHNPSQETLSIDRYYTPLSGVERPVFTLTQGADVVKYTGIWALHQESKDLYLNLAPGETMSVTVDIADYYDISSPGSYSLSWKYGSGNELALDAKHSMKRAPKILEHFSCSDEEKAEIAVADAEALMQASSAIRCLDRGEDCREMATTWFGEPSSDFGEVRTKYTAIRQIIASGHRVECGGLNCLPGIYAYVFPSDPDHVSHLCSVFWKLPSERGEVILHELSHFDDVAATDDVNYGRRNCKNLALHSPHLARENAASLGYFAKDASVAINECLGVNNPCQNGGKCVDTRQRLCECAPGFTGDLCMTECSGSSCSEPEATLPPTSNDRFEPNNVLKTATGLDVDTLYDDLNLGRYDRDWFCWFLLPHYSSFGVDVNFAHADGNIDVNVYWEGDFVFSETSTTDNEAILFERPSESGRLCVEVFQFGPEPRQHYSIQAWADIETSSASYDYIPVGVGGVGAVVFMALVGVSM